MIIFILFVIGLAAYTAELTDVTSDNAYANGINQYRIETSLVQESNSTITCDNTFDSPVSPIIFAHCNNTYSRHARNLNRDMRLMYRYNPIAFLKNGKISDLTSFRNLQSKLNELFPVKQSGNHCFIRFRKLLI